MPKRKDDKNQGTTQFDKRYLLNVFKRASSTSFNKKTVCSFDRIELVRLTYGVA
jgi:hypothetical protein